MLVRIATLAAALIGIAGPAYAGDLAPGAGRSIDLGALSGVAYYTVEPAGYRVVASIARKENTPSVRFETVLANGQTVVLSSPRELGQQAAAIEISRIDDRVVVRTPAIY